jgi:hypothetical protein
MSFVSDLHKNNYLSSLSFADLIAQRRILKAKIKYYTHVYEEAEEAELENQDDYGMLATIQAEMDYADHRIYQCELKIATVNKLLLARSIAIWKQKKSAP